MKEKELLLNKLFNDFMDKDLSIILDGTIITDFIIKNAKIAMSNRTLMITDTNKKEFILCLDDITNVKIDDYIVFEIDNQTVTIDK